jgi:hypothetical protein
VRAQYNQKIGLPPKNRERWGAIALKVERSLLKATKFKDETLGYKQTNPNQVKRNSAKLSISSALRLRLFIVITYQDLEA